MDSGRGDGDREHRASPRNDHPALQRGREDPLSRGVLEPRRFPEPTLTSVSGIVLSPSSIPEANTNGGRIPLPPRDETKRRAGTARSELRPEELVRDLVVVLHLGGLDVGAEG